jgi:Ca2+-binding EF-hand superfamily protein
MLTMTKPIYKTPAPVRACVVAALILACNTARSADGPAFQTTHAEMLAKFDKNGDGRLDDAEREQMRLVTKNQPRGKNSGPEIPADVLADYDENKDGDMDDREWGKARLAENVILMAKYDADGDGSLSDPEKTIMMNEVRTVQMRYARDYFAYLLVYDKNQNGEFNGAEYPQAQAAEARITVITYDANGDGTLDKSEKGRAQADMRSGAIVGFYLRFASEVVGGGGGNTRGRGGDYLEEQRGLLVFDVNGDGLASADELKRIRESRSAKN